MVDVDIKDKEEFINIRWKYFFSDVIHHLSQVFDGEMIADDF